MFLVVGQAREPNPGLEWRMWLAGTWFALAPPLIVSWEVRFRNTVACLIETAKSDGWSVTEIEPTVARVQRSRKFVVLGTSVAIASGFLGSQQFFGDAFGLSQPSSSVLLLGFVMTAWLGVTFGYGFWGVGSMLSLERVALANHRTLRWDPFTARQIPGLESLSSFAYVTGFLFSIGAVFLPATLLIIGDLPVAPRAIGVAAAGLLLLGGAASFLIPSLWIERVVRNQRNDCIDSLSRILDSHLRCAQRGTSLDKDQLEPVLLLREEIMKTSAAPLAFQVGVRTSSLIFLPVVIAFAAEGPLI